MKVSECMTSQVETVNADQTVQEAAKFMLQADEAVPFDQAAACPHPALSRGRGFKMEYSPVGRGF